MYAEFPSSSISLCLVPNAPFPSRGNVSGVSIPFCGFQPSSQGLGGCGTVSQCCDVQTLLYVPRESWKSQEQLSEAVFTFQDSPGCQFDYFFALNLPLQLHLVLPSYEALVLDPGNSSPSFSMPFKGRKNPHNAYFISRYPHSSALLGSYALPSQILMVDELHWG